MTYRDAFPYLNITVTVPTLYRLCIINHCTVLYCTDFVTVSVLLMTVPYCTLLHCTLLHCTVLYCTALFSWCHILIISLPLLFCTNLKLSLYLLVARRSCLHRNWFQLSWNYVSTSFQAGGTSKKVGCDLMVWYYGVILWCDIMVWFLSWLLCYEYGILNKLIIW